MKRRVGGAHSQYFLSLQAALQRANLYRPTLVIDRERLRFNIGRLKAHLPANKKFRIVAKSVPALDLIREIRAGTNTDRLMVFHQPHINMLAQRMPDAQILLGKPMPAGAAKRFFDLHRPNAFDAPKQIEWLIDTHERLAQYRELARAQRGASPMRINLEIDVGLHRGGFRNAQDVAQAVQMIANEPALTFSGFMGYEPHAAKLPGFLGGPHKLIAKSMAFYSECIAAAREVLGTQFVADALTLNAGGSNTYEYYDASAPCNEITVGSALLKPTDFDTAGLADHEPAAFVATPVLKALDRTDLPGFEWLTKFTRWWDPNTERAFFIYGGYWLAGPVSPPGLRLNPMYGRTTNQEMLNGSTDVQLKVDDFVFLRPSQSEFVLLQFGDIAVYERGEIVDYWPVFPETERA